MSGITAAAVDPGATPTAVADLRRDERARGRTTAWWGMVLFIATEATLFAMLFLSYLYLRFSATPVWPPEGIEAPALIQPAIMTALLVSSSATMVLAARIARRDGPRAARPWLAATAALAIGFLVLQVVEYVSKSGEFTPRTNSYGSLFYTITGFHGIHVVVGLVMIVWVIATARGRGSDRRSIENVSLYWHFVDVVWLVVFSVLYLAVRW